MKLKELVKESTDGDLTKGGREHYTIEGRKRL